MPTCNVKFVSDPTDLALWIAGPVPGDKDDNDCAIGALTFDPITTTNGEATLNLQKDERYCVQYYLHDKKKKKYAGKIRLYCEDSDSAFDVLLADFDTKGIADGHECFRTECE